MAIISFHPHLSVAFRRGNESSYWDGWRYLTWPKNPSVRVQPGSSNNNIIKYNYLNLFEIFPNTAIKMTIFVWFATMLTAIKIPTYVIFFPIFNNFEQIHTIRVVMFIIFIKPPSNSEKSVMYSVFSLTISSGLIIKLEHFHHKDRLDMNICIRLCWKQKKH